MLTGAWLLALLMAGAPLVAMAGGNDWDDDGADASDPAEVEVQDAADRDAAEEGAPPPTDYEFILGSGGDHSVPGFRPGTDTLTLNSDTWDFDLFDLGVGGGSAALEILLGDARSVLRFPGLDALPVDDIFLYIAESGAEAEFVALSEALHPEDDDALQPTDPDAPDIPPDPPSFDPPLPPADPDAPEDALHAPDDAEPLAPTDPDALEDSGPP
jgi:hypothetical protein